MFRPARKLRTADDTEKEVDGAPGSVAGVVPVVSAGPGAGADATVVGAVGCAAVVGAAVGAAMLVGAGVPVGAAELLGAAALGSAVERWAVVGGGVTALAAGAGTAA